jgi:hypothetical protein
MKRVTVFVVVMLTLGTRVFAQEAQATARSPLDAWSFGGFLYSTAGYDIDNEHWGGSEVVIDGESASYLYYTRLTADWKRGDLVVSLGFNILANYDLGSNTGMPNPSLYWAYGQMPFFNDILLVQLGKVRDITYSSMGRLNTDGGEGSGGMFHIRPVTGLSFGMGIFIPETGGNLEEAKISFGAAYELNKIFKIAAAGNYSNSELDMLTGGVSLLNVPNLRASAEVVMKQASAGDDHPLVVIDQVLSYRIKDLSFGMTAYQFLNKANKFVKKATDGIFNSTPIPDTQAARLGLSFDPWVSYQINRITPRMDFTFESYGVKRNTVLGTEQENERFKFTVKPSCGIRLGMVSQLSFSYTFGYTYDTVTGEDAAIKTSNQVAVVFIAALM